MAVVAAAPAQAAPSATFGGGASTSRGAKASGSKRPFAWPERVIAGNAISLVAPFQIGAVGYLPKARIGFQYDRQLYRAHWLYAGVAFLGDHGDWKNFRMENCGLSVGGAALPGSCESGSVLGVDFNVGYVYKWFLEDVPYLVPQARLGLGLSWWKYPRIGGSREQVRDNSWAISLRPGGGVRAFLRDDLAIGVDLNLPVGVLIHRDDPLDAVAENRAGFLLGFEILPIVVEYRF